MDFRMRRLCAFLIAACVLLLAAVPGSAQAGAQRIATPASGLARQAARDIAYRCGMFDGHFGCRQISGSIDHGKSSNPVVETPAEEPPPDAAPTEPAAPPPSAGQWNQNVKQEAVQPGEHSCPPGYRVLAAPNQSGSYCEPPQAAAASNGACGHGMVGTPPNCACPRNSELLGGNCVHYTAVCRTGLPANVPPQPCQGADEKLACKTHDNGLKDCCCLTYDKM
jgi:hypothetical protein